MLRCVCFACAMDGFMQIIQLHTVIGFRWHEIIYRPVYSRRNGAFGVNDTSRLGCVIDF